MRTRVVATALAAGILAGACSTSPPGPSPTSTGPSPTISLPPTPSQTPSVAPAATLHSGRAKLQVTGGVKDRLSLPLSPPGASIWQPATGEISLKYLTRDGNALLVDGTLKGHSARTSTTLTLSFVLQNGGSEAFSSSRGECRVTITRSSGKRVAGKFSCANLHSLGSPRKKVSATGTFDGSR